MPTPSPARRPSSNTTSALASTAATERHLDLYGLTTRWRLGPYQRLCRNHADVPPPALAAIYSEFAARPAEQGQFPNLNATDRLTVGGAGWAIVSPRSHHPKAVIPLWQHTRSCTTLRHNTGLPSTALDFPLEQRRDGDHPLPDTSYSRAETDNVASPVPTALPPGFDATNSRRGGAVVAPAGSLVKELTSADVTNARRLQLLRDLRSGCRRTVRQRLGLPLSDTTARRTGRGQRSERRGRRIALPHPSQRFISDGLIDPAAGQRRAHRVRDTSTFTTATPLPAYPGLSTGTLSIRAVHHNRPIAYAPASASGHPTRPAPSGRRPRALSATRSSLPDGRGRRPCGPVVEQVRLKHGAGGTLRSRAADGLGVAGERTGPCRHRFYRPEHQRGSSGSAWCPCTFPLLLNTMPCVR